MSVWISKIEMRRVFIPKHSHFYEHVLWYGPGMARHIQPLQVTVHGRAHILRTGRATQAWATGHLELVEEHPVVQATHTLFCPFLEVHGACSEQVVIPLVVLVPYLKLHLAGLREKDITDVKGRVPSR